jgi:hypothetical protein
MQQSETKYSLSAVARRMANIGILTVPTKSNKRSTIKWKDVNLHTINDSYWHNFEEKEVLGLALVAGKRSGGLECIDVDCKYDLEGNLMEMVLDTIMDASVDLYNKLVIARTPSGGYHIMYRTKIERRNMKLAQRLRTQEELDADPELKGVNQPLVLIETRGEGGYFLGWPSPGYSFTKGNYAEIMDITDEESDLLIQICKSFDKVPKKVTIEDAEKNPNAEEYKVPKSIDKGNKYLVKPWDDYNQKGDVVSFMQEMGWKYVRHIPSPDDGRLVVYLKRPGSTDKDVSATYNHVPGKVYCFTSSTSLPLNKPLSPFEVFMYLKHNGIVKNAVLDLEAMGYGVRASNTSEVAPKDNIQKSNVERALERQMSMVKGDTLEIWWEVKVTEKKEVITKNIIVKQFKLCEWLAAKGLRSQKVGGNYEWLMLDGVIIDRVTKKDIGNFIIEFIKGLPEKFDYITRDELMETFFKGIDIYLSDLKLSTVPLFDNNLLMRDNQEESYIAFKNGVLVISKEGEKVVKYHKFYRYIYRDNIKDFEYDTPMESAMDSHPYSRFMYNVAGRDLNRYEQLLQMVGYCMSTYKDPSTPAAVVLCDSKVSDRSEGGTGKGLLVKGMSYIRTTMYEDGKIANKKNQSEFRFSRIEFNTELLHLSDVEKGFDFEAMFTLLTEGIPVNKKFKAEEFIPYDKSPKIIISTNYSIGGRGSSHDRRRIEFELADYYSAKKTPYLEFGHHFFDGWSPNQWNIFYGIMSRAIRLYLIKGIPQFSGINIELRKFRDETSSDFVSWFFSMFGTKDEIYIDGPKYVGKILFASLYNEYLSYAGLERHETRPQRFLRYMHSGISYVGLELEESSERKTSFDAYERYLIIKDTQNKERIKRMEESLKIK